MPFDAASVAALVAQAAARTFDQSFVITAEATARLLTSTSAGIPAAASIAPIATASARFYSFQANYRRRLVSGSLVADVAYDLIARGLLAQYALDQFDYVDRRYPPIFMFGQLINPD